MKYLLLSIFVIAFGQMLSATSAASAEEKKAPQMPDFNKILKDRADTTAYLIQVVKTSKDTRINGAKSVAIELLGRLRCSDLAAIQVLVDEFDYLPEQGPVDEILPDYGYYPAATALKEIGLPVYNQLFNRYMRNGATTDEWHRATLVVMDVEGKEEAVSRFERMAKHTVDVHFKARWEAAAQYLRTYKPSFEYPKRDASATPSGDQ